MQNRLMSFALVLAVSGLASAAPPKSGAARPAAKAAAGPKKSELERWRGELTSGSEVSDVQALREIAAYGPNGAPPAPLVDALLARGANVAVLAVALETSGSLAQPASSAELAPYVRHRRPELRQAAAQALAKTGGPLAVSALRSALHTSDKNLRSSAATGLGTLGASEAVDELFGVLSQGTAQAAPAIASLCSPAECDRFMELVGKLEFETLESGFIPLLFRPPAALPDEHKLRYVDRLRRLATKSAGRTLKKALAELPKEQSPALRAALESALRGRPIAEGDQ